MTRGDLEPFSDSVDEMFAKLGLPDPVMMATMSSEWDQLAGPPWASRSIPLYMTGGTLVVEASSSSMVAFLRYAETALLDKLAARFGPDRVKSVEVQPPGRSR
jgi:predicted nucleic acid-binding Zn ribbon protein